MDGWLLGALAEDIGGGDVTTECLAGKADYARVDWTAKSSLVVCGLPVCFRTFELLSKECSALFMAQEGTRAEPGQVVLSLAGPAGALLSGERVALNIAQHLSGVATSTARFVAAVEGTGARIAATRKTIPYNRRLEKYAVTVGGGVPHRYGLDDGVLIKDNHIALAGSITQAVQRARSLAHHLLKIEVEVENMGQAEEAVKAGADLLLLDNMTLDMLREAVKTFKGKVILEASGNVTIDVVRSIAETGVDIISTGAITHSVIAADVSARLALASRPEAGKE